MIDEFAALGATLPQSTVACQKSGIYPRFDSAAPAGLHINTTFGMIPYLILILRGLQHRAFAISLLGTHNPGKALNIEHCWARTPFTVLLSVV
jgi:hypothetical protein